MLTPIALGYTKSRTNLIRLLGVVNQRGVKMKRDGRLYMLLSRPVLDVACVIYLMHRT